MTHVIKIFCFLVAALAAVTNGVPEKKLTWEEMSELFPNPPALEECIYYSEDRRLECFNYRDSNFPLCDNYVNARTIKLLVDTPKQVTFGAGYDKVEEIYVRYSEATEISLAAFNVFKSLVTLKVRAYSGIADGSLISRVNFTGVGVVESLQNIDLRDNSISEFVGGSFNASYPNLKSLDLGINALTEFDFESVPKSLSKLNIDSNDIAKLSGLDALKKLHHLGGLFRKLNKTLRR